MECPKRVLLLTTEKSLKEEFQKSKLFNAISDIAKNSQDFGKYEIIVAEPKLLANESLLKQVFDKKTSKVKWIHSSWAGVDSLMKFTEGKFMDEEHSHRPILSKTVGNLHHLMFEYILQQVLNQERKLGKLLEMNERGEWVDDDLCSYRSLSDLRIGILGFGSIGKYVCEKLQLLNVTKISVFKRTKKESTSNLRFYTDLATFLANLDYVINILPSTPSTRGLLDNESLKNCTGKTIFINVGRGDVISESSIMKAIQNDWISRAILDVVYQEPLPKESRLWKEKRVIISPHVSGISFGRDVFREFLNLYREYEKGEKMKNVVNWEDGY